MTRFADVVVISIDAESRSLPTDIGSYLATHGIKAEILSLVSGGDTVAHVLLDESRNADLVVMGPMGFLQRLRNGSVALPRRCGPSANTGSVCPIKTSDGFGGGVRCSHPPFAPGYLHPSSDQGLL